jgi:hypothetical protein
MCFPPFPATLCAGNDFYAGSGTPEDESAFMVNALPGDL